MLREDEEPPMSTGGAHSWEQCEQHSRKQVPRAEKLEEVMEQGGHRRGREAAPWTSLVGLKQQDQEGRTLTQPQT